MKNLKHQKYKNDNIEAKYLDNTQRNGFLKVENSILELGNNFTQIKK